VSGALFYPRFAALELRRAFGTSAALAFALYVALLASGRWSSPVGAALSADHALAERGLAREAIVSGALLFLAPWVLLHAGGTIGRWRARESDWLASRPATRAGLIVSAWIGMVGAAGAALAIVVAITLVRAGWGEASWRFLGAQTVDHARRIEPGESLRFALSEPARESSADSRLRVHLARTLGSGAHSLAPAEVELVLAREGGSARSFHVRLQSRARVELGVPDGEGALGLTISNAGPSSTALLTDRSFEFWAAGPREGWGSLEIAWRALLTLAAASALALGLGAWMSAPSAMALTLSAWLYATTLASSRAWIPGARLLRDLEFLSDGRLPETPGLAALAGTLLIAAAGVALACNGLRSWRRLA
jgi:hypothetical protein